MWNGIKCIKMKKKLNGVNWNNMHWNVACKLKLNVIKWNQWH